MNGSLETRIPKICPSIRIEQVDPQSESTLAQRKKIIDTLEKSKEWVYLDDGVAQFRFFAWLPEYEDAVGIRSLVPSSTPGMYALSSMVHPDFRNRGVSTALAVYAVEFAKDSEEIKALYGHVRPGSYAEKTLKSLGFECMGPPSPESKNLTYLLRVR